MKRLKIKSVSLKRKDNSVCWFKSEQTYRNNINTKAAIRCAIDWDNFYIRKLIWR